MALLGVQNELLCAWRPTAAQYSASLPAWLCGQALACSRQRVQLLQANGAKVPQAALPCLMCCSGIEWGTSAAGYLP